MQNHVVKHPNSPSRRSRALFVLGVLVVYALALVPLYRVLGSQAITFSILPVAAAGWLLGMGPAILMSLLAFLVNVLLLALIIHNPDEVIEVFHRGGLLGSIMVMLVGTIIGQFHDLHERLKREYNERKRAEERLREANAQLQAALKAREEMLQNVSHELRTPLTLIKGYAELWKEGMLGPLTPAQEKAAAILNSQCDRLRYMIDRLILIQTLSTTSLRETQVDLNRLLQEAVQAWQAHAEKEGIQLSLELPSHLPPITGDRNLLSHVIYNLLDNAIKFSPDGGAVSVCARLEDGELLITVSDQGIGIPPDKLEQVFERFYQVDGGSTRRFGGMGIGLALCREIIQLHGGRIWAESEGDGRGSAFHIRLPLRTPPPGTASQCAASAQQPPSGQPGPVRG